MNDPQPPTEGQPNVAFRWVTVVSFFLVAPVLVWLPFYLDGFRFSTASYLILAVSFWVLPALLIGWSRWRHRQRQAQNLPPRAVVDRGTARRRMIILIFVVVTVFGIAFQLSQRSGA